MDMDLVPRYADEGLEGVRIDPTQTQNLGLKTALVTTGRLTYSRDLPANVEFNGYQRARLQSRSEGFVAQTMAFSPGDPIKEGDTIAIITAPSWASDQSEYLLLKSQKADRKIINGVREKLRLSGIPEEMLKEVDRTGRPQTDLHIKSPINGVITTLDLYPGMNVAKNMTLAEIQGFDPIWVTAEVPEMDLALTQGRVRVTAPAWPNRVFESIKTQLLPQANKEARTTPLRITVANPEGLLRPGLSAVIRLRTTGPEGLIIPSQSLIDLGEDQRVITVTKDGLFAPKAVKVGGASREETLVVEGLNPGDSVVVNGLFLIDSEANLAGALERMTAPSPPANPPSSQPTSHDASHNASQPAASQPANHNASHGGPPPANPVGSPGAEGPRPRGAS
jgi:Cu(I)/Ag(I) efflux system membrane fusion protein